MCEVPMKYIQNIISTSADNFRNKHSFHIAFGGLQCIPASVNICFDMKQKKLKIIGKFIDIWAYATKIQSSIVCLPGWIE